MAAKSAIIDAMQYETSVKASTAGLARVLAAQSERTALFAIKCADLLKHAEGGALPPICCREDAAVGWSNGGVEWSCGGV